MPPRPAVTQLPDPVKAELDHRLIAGGFSGYRHLAEWLEGQGFSISKSALHDYGQSFERRMAALTMATQQAKAIAEAAGDDEGALNDALIRLIQEKAFSALVEMEESGALDLIDLGHMAAKLGQTSVQQKKWQVQAREQITRKFAALEKEAAGGKGGLDMATLKRVREEVYGIV